MKHSKKIEIINNHASLRELLCTEQGVSNVLDIDPSRMHFYCTQEDIDEFMEDTLGSVADIELEMMFSDITITETGDFIIFELLDLEADDDAVDRHFISVANIASDNPFGDTLTYCVTTFFGDSEDDDGFLQLRIAGTEDSVFDEEALDNVTDLDVKDILKLLLVKHV